MSDTEANSGLDGKSTGDDATAATKDLIGEMNNAEAVMFYALVTWSLTGAYYILPKLIDKFSSLGEFGWITDQMRGY